MRHRHAGQELAKNCVDCPAPAVSRVSLFRKGGASRDEFPSSGELTALGRFRKRAFRDRHFETTGRSLSHYWFSESSL
jgi:hypothetical protein